MRGNYTFWSTAVSFCCVAYLVTDVGRAQSDPIAVWSPNPAVAIFDGPDYGAMDDPATTININGTRNGTFTGQAVVFFKGPVKGVAAKISNLICKENRGVIPASAITIKYAWPSGTEGQANKRFPGVKSLKRFDALYDMPQDQPVQTHPIWIKVRVAADAKPGSYAGTMTVGGRAVPVSLKVADWRLPDPENYISHMGLVESPETVAFQYKVARWSEKHWELIGKSFDLMAEVGNKVIVIPLICQSNFGNEESMVRWLRTEKEDVFQHDFTIVEKYLDLYINRIGKPSVVILYVNEPFLGGGHGRIPADYARGVRVSLFNKASNTVEVLEGPCLNNPRNSFTNYPGDMQAFWKPVLDGMRERLAKRGLGDETIMIGISGDMDPGKNTMLNLKPVAPYARWTKQGHGYATDVRGWEVGYHTYVWGAKNPPEPSTLRYYGWKQKFQACIFPREGASITLWENTPMGAYHTAMEAVLTGNARGIGRIGADFWPVLGEREKRNILARFPLSNWMQLNLSSAAQQIFEPGPDGALSTIRFENLREGIQESEARIFIEKTLSDKELRTKIGVNLAKTAQEMLDERVNTYRQVNLIKTDAKGWEWFAKESGWQGQAERLFAGAADVAYALDARVAK